MHIRRYFCDSAPQNRCLTVKGDTFFHLKSVVKVKPGSVIELTDGKGNLYTCTVSEIKSSSILAREENSQYREKPAIRSIIGVSVLKKRAMNLLVEKLSEMGTDLIVPLIFERSEREFSSASAERWRKIAYQSLKVNHKVWAAEISEPVCIREFLDNTDKNWQKIFLNIGSRPLKISDISDEHPCLCIVGPPGDYTDKEKLFLEERGCMPAGISSAVLKAETAAISAQAVLSLKNMQGSGI